MKIKTRIISIMMIMMMLISGMSFGSFAASSGTGTVYVNVTQDYANAQKMLKLVNKQRAKKHLKKLKLDKSLTDSAVQRAAEISMVIPNTSPHRRPDGRVAKTVNKKAARENCAEGSFGSASAVVKTWMHSKPHKAAILLKSAKSCGIAYVTNPADPEAGYYVLIVSNKKAKKVEKSKRRVSSTKAVVALSKYLNKKYFFPEDAGNRSTLNIGQITSVKTYYSGPQTLDFTAPEINPGSFIWTSSDNSVATVNASGTVTAVGPGTVTINAKLKSGPSITLSTTYTVNKGLAENAFDNLTGYFQSGEANDIWYGDKYGYEEGYAFAKGITGSRSVYDSYEDPETGEEIDISYMDKSENIIAMESLIGKEVAFQHMDDFIDNDVRQYQYRTYMIVSKEGNKVSDKIKFIHEYVDGDFNVIYKLEASSNRSSVNVENLQWKVVKDAAGETIDYEIPNDHINDIFYTFAYYTYLKDVAGVKFGDFGIKQVIS